MGLCKCHYFFAGSFATLDAAAVDGNDVTVNSQQVGHRDGAAGLGVFGRFPYHEPSNAHTTVARGLLLLQAISCN